MASENVDMEDASPIPPEDKGEDPSTELERIANFARCDVFVQRSFKFPPKWTLHFISMCYYPEFLTSQFMVSVP